MSSLRTILVHLDAGPHGAARLRAARRVAARHGASVAALYAATPAFMAMPMDLAAAAASAAVDALISIDEGRMQAARRSFDEVCSEPGPAVEWREAREMPVDPVVRQAYYADLLVLGQDDPSNLDNGVPGDFVQGVLMNSCKPALVVPYIDADAPIGDRVLIAWKESPEAAHAVTAALPLLRRAAQVHVACGTDEDGRAAPADRLLAYLRQHDVQAEAHRFQSAASDAGERLLSLAADVSADLLVMGCYGHSRARELVLGGATRTVLRSMTLPVLMSH